MLRYTFLVLVSSAFIVLAGCEQATSIVSQPPPAPVRSTPAPTPEPEAIPERPVEPEPEPDPEPEMDPPKPEPRPKVLPRVHRVARALIGPQIRNGQRGAEFQLVMDLDGDDLESFEYSVAIRDSKGNSKTFPMEYGSRRIRLNEFIPRAGVREPYEFHVDYRGPEAEESTPLVAEDAWGKFIFEEQ